MINLIWALAFQMSWAQSGDLPRFKALHVDDQASTHQPSCRLLKHRSLERQKLLRELQAQTKGVLTAKETSFVFGNNLIANKAFMDMPTWTQESVQISLQFRVSPELQEAIAREGLGAQFFWIEAPGFVWQSLAGQLPEDVRIELGVDQTIEVTYMTYAEIGCEVRAKLQSTAALNDYQLTWVPGAQLSDYLRTESSSELILEKAKAAVELD